MSTLHRYEITGTVLRPGPGPNYDRDVRIVEAFTAEDALVQHKISMNRWFSDGFTIDLIKPLPDLQEPGAPK